MNLKEALKWADDNSSPEAVDRLRSRKVAQTLAATVRRYAEWIREVGEMDGICTYGILNEICSDCQCGKAEKEK